MTVLPRVTCPSPPTATAPSRRTARIVVPCGLNSNLSLMRLLLRSKAYPTGALTLLTRPGPWMRRFVDAGQVLEVKVSVDLGGGDVGVPEQLLHTPQLAAGLEQMRGK